MPSARFEFPMHPTPLRIYVATGLDLAKARILLRRALCDRRRVVVEHPEVFVSLLNFEIMRTRACRAFCSIATLDWPSADPDLVFRITTKLRGSLAVPVLKLTSNLTTLYYGSLYAFVGNRAKEKRPRTVYRSSRAERLDRFEQDYYRKHGFSPQEEGGMRVYDGVATRIQKANSKLRKQIVAGRAAALRRHARRKGLRKVTLQF